jgi:hypothetical protein
LRRDFVSIVAKNGNNTAKIVSFLVYCQGLTPLPMIFHPVGTHCQGIIKKNKVDYKELNAQFSKTNKLSFQDPKGACFEWIKSSEWKPEMEGFFLIHEIYQVQSLVGNFSEVALDIVEYAADEVVFLSPQSSWFLNGGKSEGLIKFALVSSPQWKQLLHQIREMVFLKWVDEVQPPAILGAAAFPFTRKSRLIELHADGRVKIIKG